MITLTNAFSLNMINSSVAIDIREISLATAKKIRITTNAVGHADTDRVIRGMLDNPTIPVGERSTVVLSGEWQLLVAQYVGPRLPEGATALPEGAKIKWFLIEPLRQWILFGTMNDCGGSPISSPPFNSKEEADREFSDPSGDWYYYRMEEMPSRKNVTPGLCSMMERVCWRNPSAELCSECIQER